MTDIWLFNTLTREKEKLITREDNKIFIYICGPTVYNYIHIGNARCYIAFDAIIRSLEKLFGYKVTYVRNLTDVDDKIINQAIKEGISTEEVSNKYIDAFNNDMKILNVRKPEVSPKATEHIEEMKDVIKVLIEKGYAYEVDGDVFYKVEKFNDYGKLSNRTLDEMRAGERVKVDKRKKNPMDFALWKKSKEGEPYWDSDWSKGRPGWHIECSTMSEKYLGQSFDIHGGGQDLIFPHHENEIAQYEAYADKKFVNYWLHNGFVNVEDEKMAKSVGNVILVKDLIKNKEDAEALRMLFLSSHYRSPINFSSSLFEEAKKKMERLKGAWSLANELLTEGIKDEKVIIDGDIWGDFEIRLKKQREGFTKAMSDDFNTAAAIGSMFDLAKELNKRSEKFQSSGGIFSEEDRRLLKLGADTLKEIAEVLGFHFEPLKVKEEDYPVEVKEVASKFFNQQFSSSKLAIDKLLELRAEARREKDWKKADEIRKELKNIGMEIDDTPLGARVKVVTRK